MMKKFQAVTLGAAVALVLVGGGVAAAQGPGGQGRQGLRGLRGAPGIELRGADLTDGQREQIRALVQQSRESGQAVREELRQAQAAQREALAVVPVNEGLVRSTTPAVTEAQAEAALVQARLRADMLALLTPDQLEMIEDARAAREARQERVRERREQRRQSSRTSLRARHVRTARADTAHQTRRPRRGAAVSHVRSYGAVNPGSCGWFSYDPITTRVALVNDR